MATIRWQWKQDLTLQHDDDRAWADYSPQITELLERFFSSQQCSATVKPSGSLSLHPLTNYFVHFADVGILQVAFSDLTRQRPVRRLEYRGSPRPHILGVNGPTVHFYTAPNVTAPPLERSSSSAVTQAVWQWQQSPQPPVWRDFSGDENQILEMAFRQFILTQQVVHVAVNAGACMVLLSPDRTFLYSVKTPDHHQLVKRLIHTGDNRWFECPVEFNELRRQYEESLKIYSSDEFIHGNLGFLLHRAFRDLQGARAHYEAALKINPKNDLVHGHLADLLKENFNDPQGAQKHYLLAREINPDNESARVHFLQ